MSGPVVGGSPGPLADDLLRVILHEGQGSLPRYGLRERAGSARRLDVVLRAALFCDLARAGALTGTRGPVAVGGPGRPGSRGARVDGAGPADRATARDTGARMDGAGPADRATARDTGGQGTGGQGTGGQGVTAGAGSEAGGGAAGPSDRPGTSPGVAEDRILSAVLAAVSQRPGVAWPRWFRHIRDDRSALVARLVGSGRWTAQGGHHFRDADPRGAERLQARTFTVSELVEAPTNDRETMLGYLYALAGPGMSAEHVLGWDVRLARLDASPSGPTVRAVLAAARSVNRRGRFSRR